MTPAQQNALESCVGRALTPPEIAAIDPLLSSGRKDMDIAAILSDGRVRQVHAPIASIQAYIQAHGIWWVLKSAAADSTHAGQQAAAAVLEVASARYENIDLQLSFVGYVFSALVTAGLMTTDDLAAITALGTAPNPVPVGDVSDALNRVSA